MPQHVNDFKHFIEPHQVKNFLKVIVEAHGHNPINIVAPYRGALPMAVQLNNVIDGSTLSIVKFQTRDGDDELPTWMVNNINPDFHTIILDDIYDTGVTIDTVSHWVNKQLMDFEADVWCLVGKSGKGIRYFVDHPGKWVVFPWEVL